MSNHHRMDELPFHKSLIRNEIAASQFGLQYPNLRQFFVRIDTGGAQAGEVLCAAQTTANLQIFQKCARKLRGVFSRAPEGSRKQTVFHRLTFRCYYVDNWGKIHIEAKNPDGF